LLRPPGSTRDFNEEVARAIHATLSEILGEHSLRALYGYLKDHYDIGSEEIPYRLPAVIRVLEEMFGAVGATAIGSDVAKKLYGNLGLRFIERSNHTLEDYLKDALKLLQ
jgi:hypothetical protein